MMTHFKFIMLNREKKNSNNIKESIYTKLCVMKIKGKYKTHLKFM
jgi:hypothetical protein